MTHGVLTQCRRTGFHRISKLVLMWRACWEIRYYVENNVYKCFSLWQFQLSVPVSSLHSWFPAWKFIKEMVGHTHIKFMHIMYLTPISIHIILFPLSKFHFPPLLFHIEQPAWHFPILIFRIKQPPTEFHPKKSRCTIYDPPVTCERPISPPKILSCFPLSAPCNPLSIFRSWFWP